MIIDITCKIKQGMIFMEGAPPFSIKRIKCISKEKKEFKTDLICTPVHFGTHIDVVYKKKDIKVNRFIGKGIIFDIPTIKREIKISDIEEIERIKENHFIFFRTKWDKYFGTSKYFDHPEFSFEVIKYLVIKNINMVGIDAPGLAKGPKHRKYDSFLAKNNIFLIENLTNLNRINNVFNVYCFPLNLNKTETYPARVIVDTID